MELSDVARRIFRRHWVLIVVCLVLGMLGAFALSRSATVYTASARLVLDTPDPSDRSAATSVADIGKAIATSPAQVSEALKAAGIRDRDADKVAAHHVDVTGLATSGILELSVTDRNARVAAAIANALSRRVIQARLSITKGGQDQVLESLDSRITDLSKEIADADAAINSLTVELSRTTDPNSANSLRGKRDAESRRRDFLAKQQSLFDSERVSLLATNAERPKPAIISPAAIPAHPAASHRSADLFLGILLGAIFGIGIAGFIEAFRPTLVGSDAIARELDLPLLGALPARPAEASSERLFPAALRLRLAAEAAGTDEIVLVGAATNLDLGSLAERLQAVPVTASSPAGAEAKAEAFAATWQRGLRIRPFAYQSAVGNGAKPAGIVLVAPAALKKNELRDLEHLLSVTPLPLLGVLTHAAPSRLSFARPRRRNAPRTRVAPRPHADAAP
jgi:capsular polysaccharide biosynthesis protein